MTEINEANLLAAGYQKHRGGQVNNSDWLFQKRFRNSSGATMYFINVDQYVDLNERGDGWMPTVQLYLPGHTQTLSVTMISFETIPQIESFVERAYRLLECEPDTND